MSWIWGTPSKPSLPSDFKDFVPPSGGSPPDSGDNKASGGSSSGGSGAMDAYRFDSSALERAAKAAKDLEKNPNSKEILELSREQEKTKQEEMKQMSIGMQAELERKRAQDNQEAMQKKFQQDKALADYRDKLARKKEEESREIQRQIKMEEVEMERRKQEDMIRRESEAQERRLQRENEEFDKRMKKQSALDMQRVDQEIKSRGKVERDNHDLNIEKLKLQAKEDRETKLESLKSFSSLFGSGFNYFLSDKQKVGVAVGGTVALIAGVIFSKQAISVAFRQIEARLMKPALIRETSRITMNDLFKHPIQSVRKYKERFNGSGDALKGVILKPETEEAVRNIVIEAKQSRKVNSHYSNLLLYGPPGTGKTLFAKKLSMNSDMDYAIMTGGDMQLFGGKGVDQVHKVFEWANTSKKGLILYIDEAESFLAQRQGKSDQSLRETLAAFLYHTGSESQKFMMILTSNLPHELDSAILSRVDDSVELGLPGLQERIRIVALYFQKYILDAISSKKMRIKLSDNDWSAVCRTIAEMTEGLSGRDLDKLAKAWQKRTASSDSGVLTSEIMIQSTKRFMNKKSVNKKWDMMKSQGSLQYSEIMKESFSNMKTPKGE